MKYVQICMVIKLKQKDLNPVIILSRYIKTSKFRLGTIEYIRYKCRFYNYY